MKKLGFIVGVLVGLAAFDATLTASDAEEIPTITAIMENGPSANRINVVFLSEAYVASQRETYFSDVQIATDSLFQFTPFKEYRNYFNVYAIWVASQDSFVLANEDWGEGDWLYVTELGAEPVRWSSILGDSGYWVWIPEDGRPSPTYFGFSEGKAGLVIRKFFQSTSPVIAVALVNDDKESAVGGSGSMTIGTGRFHHNPSITNRIYAGSVIHEFGHALGGLQDEYNGNLVPTGQTDRDYPGGPYINVTTENRRDRVRWKHWIEPATPVPTPRYGYNVYTYTPDSSSVVSWVVRDTSDYADKVGLFEGANIYSRGWYRPKLNCAMRGERGWDDPLPPFCEVCREALVLEIYRQVDPTGEIDLTVGETSTVFSINPPQPTDHNLSIQWLVDGNVAPRQNSNQLEVTERGVGYGRHIVTVTVEDTTEWVRQDTAGFLARALEWRPIVYYPPPDFSGDGLVDFTDFFQFADVFGRPVTNQTEKFDLDWSGGLIDFTDFFLFADAFGSQ